MKLADVRKNAFAMPLNNPAYPRGPYKFHNREFVIVTYRTDPDIVRALVPEPLEPINACVAPLGTSRFTSASTVLSSKVLEIFCSSSMTVR